MATHYLTDASVIACGKASAPDCSADAEKVTCKNCLRSQAFTQREAGAEQSSKAAAPSVTHDTTQALVNELAAKPSLSVVMPAGSGKTSSKRKPKVVAKASKGVAFAEWRQRFGSNERLPRGKAFASM